jgi:hypothetical protein
MPTHNTWWSPANCLRTTLLQILLHPRWGSYIYPASIFAKAPLETIQLALSVASDAMAAEDHGRMKQWQCHEKQANCASS